MSQSVKRSASGEEGHQKKKPRTADDLAVPSTSRQPVDPPPALRSFEVVYLGQVRSKKFRYARTYSKVSVRVPTEGAMDLTWLSNYLDELLQFFDRAHDTAPTDLVGLTLEAMNSPAQAIWVAVKKRQLLTMATILDAISATTQSHDVFHFPGTLCTIYTPIKIPTVVS